MEKETKINARAFERILKERGITTLYHFTDRSNLESIIENGGLFSWEDCSELGIEIPMPGGDSLSRELDRKKGLGCYVHTSFIKKHPMMFQAKREGRIEDPIILEIDPEVITWVDTLFSAKNAIRSDTSCGMGLDDFVKIHYDTINSTTRFDIENEEIPFLQAEVMVKNCIPLKFIKNIDKFGIYILDMNEHLDFVHHTIYAEKGNAYEQLCLGMDYYYGKAGHQDLNEAFKWYKASAEQGLAEAQFRLALCYDNGEGTNSDYSKALYWYEKAAQQDHLDAIYNLAATYSNGIEIDVDSEKAFYWFKKGAELGSSDCQRFLGRCYENGYGVVASTEDAIKWYSAAALQGNTDAQNDLAVLYHFCFQDYTNALKWFTQAAELGHPEAQCYLGMYYKDGICVDVDYEESVYWYKMAAEQGVPDAQYNLGCFYFRGLGIKKNIDKAASWFTKGAQGGDANAQANLGFCYITGQGVPYDPSLAIKWWKKAADQGHQGAIKNLEIAKEHGDL